jgi:hypothetical protein
MPAPGVNGYEPFWRDSARSLRWPKSLLREPFSFYLHFVVDYVTRVTYESGTIQNCAWTVTAQRPFEPLTNARGYNGY